MDILTIKNKIKEYIKLLFICPDYGKIINQLKYNNNRRIILFGTPAHGNLGDHAIALTELDFFCKYCPNYDVIEIPMPLLKTHRRTIVQYVNPSDVVVISGGGWMGNLWIHNEFTIREIVNDYPHNMIIIFPQTLYYTDDEGGNNTIRETREIFEKHNNLILTVRDVNSMKCAIKKMGFQKGKNLFWCPDMVLFGTLSQKPSEFKEGKIAMLCLRNDIEKTADTVNIRDILRNYGYQIVETSTVLDHLVPRSKRLEVVLKKIDEFKNVSFVLTDRLHAMLFSVLAGTPCIALDNRTGKVFGVGQYLKKAGMPINLVRDFDISNIQLGNLKRTEYTLPQEFEQYFLRLAELINNKETN